MSDELLASFVKDLTHSLNMLKQILVFDVPQDAEVYLVDPKKIVGSIFNGEEVADREIGHKS